MEEPKLPTGVEVSDKPHVIESDRIAVVVKTKLDFDPKLGGLWFRRVNKRGGVMDLHGIEFNAEKNVLSFIISQDLHDSLKKAWGELKPQALVATSYWDFCHLLSDGTSEKSVPFLEAGVETEVAGLPVTLGDITQVLPSKFADEVNEVLGTMNWEVLDGIIEHAVMYGPLIINKEGEKR